jgi:hypothetical protein
MLKNPIELTKFKYGRGFIGVLLGRPKPSSRVCSQGWPFKVMWQMMRQKGFRLHRSMSFMTYKGSYYLIYGCIFRGCVAPPFAMHFFQAHLLSIHYFFHVLRNDLKAIVLAWCSNNDNVIHKYLA